jgi:hypothetical protein
MPSFIQGTDSDLFIIIQMASATLPEGLFFDLISEEEIHSVHALEVQGEVPSKLLQHLVLLAGS